VLEEHVGTIFEACAFQDITGQRISKVVDALQSFEQRLDRFIGAVRARDAAITDPAERARQERADKLMLNGPQAQQIAPSQDDIDALFA
jgi:chemotaxis protein CheZ